MQARLNALIQEVALLRQQLDRNKRAETKLLERERHYRTIFNDAAVGLARIGPDGRFIDVNPQFCRMLGYGRNELLGRSYLDITNPDDREADIRMRNRLLSGELQSAGSEKRYVRKDGTLVWVKLNLSVTRTPEGRLPDVLSVIENVSERHLLQKSLGRIAANLAETQRMVLGGTWEWDIERDEFLASPEILYLLSMPADHPPLNFEFVLSKVHPDDRELVQSTLRRALADDKLYQVEGRLTGPNGRQHIISASCVVHRRNEKGDPVLMVGTVHDITMRSQAERALRDSEQRFRQLFDNAVDGILIADRDDDRYTGVNLSACTMLGYRWDELIGKRVIDLLPATDMERLAQAKEYFLHNPGHVQVAEWELKRKDGSYIPVEISSRMLPDGRWMAVARDIGDRKRTQRELERYAAEVRDLYDNAPCGFHSLDRDGLIVQMNRTELDWLGYDASEVIGRKRMTELLTAESQGKFQLSFLRLLETGMARDIELDLVRKDGTILPVLLNASAAYDEQGNFVRSRTTLFDMTALAEAQKKLRQAAAVFEHTNDAIIIADPAGTITAVNNAFTRITGYLPEEVIGKNPRLLKSELQDDAFYREMWHALETTGAWQGEIRDRRKSGENFPAWECITAVRDESGNVTEYISVFSDITTIKETEEKLLRLAYHDPLTGLPNRLLLKDRAEQALAYARRHGTRMALLLLDLDRFKLINDTLGHAAGDQLLQAIALRLQQTIRKEDTVARLGGDEFAVVLAQPDHAADAAQLARKLVSVIAQPLHIAGQELTVSASIGIGMFPEDATDPETLAKCADMAMYGAKQNGRNAYAFYTSEMTDAARETLSIDRGLRNAIDFDELELLYQPQIDLSCGRIIGVEALLRWHRPGQGPESPVKFIPVAEASDLIESIGNWVFDKACAQLDRWRMAGLPPLRLAINLSARQLRNPRFVEDIRERLAALCRDDGFILDLEITESTLQTAPHIVDALKELKSLGLQIAIDDFGTGYSSLNSLKHLPVDILKIDRSFIHGIPGNADDKAITSAIVAMGHSLGMKIIAEGIETQQQLEFIIEQRCDEAQGFLIHPPLGIDECTRILTHTQPVSLPRPASCRRSAQLD